jgi:hypothetical protein
MVFNDLATIHKPAARANNDRREKFRFPMQRQARYKVLKDGAIQEAGTGHTIDMGSGGVLVYVENDLAEGAFIQLSVSWPVLLDDSCPMRLVIFGRVLRSVGRKCACSVDKYEFRTQARVVQTAPARTDSGLERWADGFRKEHLKRRLAVV